MTPASHQLCFLIDWLFDPVHGRTLARGDDSPSLPPTPSGHPALPVPAEPSALWWAPDEGVHLIPTGGGDPRFDRGAAETAGAGAAVCTLEPVWFDSSQRLAVLASDAATPLRINGQPPPRLSLLSEGDQLLLPGGVVLHLSVYHRPYVGPARPEHVGEKCLVCRTPFTPQSVLYACPWCGRGMHHEQRPAPEADEPLQCAATSSECPACQRPVVLVEGFRHVPEDA
jgi:hypothetical protein